MLQIQGKGVVYIAVNRASYATIAVTVGAYKRSLNRKVFCDHLYLTTKGDVHRNKQTDDLQLIMLKCILSDPRLTCIRVILMKKCIM